MTKQDWRNRMLLRRYLDKQRRRFLRALSGRPMTIAECETDMARHGIVAPISAPKPIEPQPQI